MAARPPVPAPSPRPDSVVNSSHKPMVVKRAQWPLRLLAGSERHCPICTENNKRKGIPSYFL